MLKSQQNIVITGVSRGIGKSCALSLANSNSHLVLISRSEKELNELALQCRNLGAKTTIIAIDLVDMHAVRAAIENLHHNIGAINILINNAGIWVEESFEQGDMDIWDDALDVNLKSAIHLTRYCLISMPEGGSIIFIGSTASRRTYGGGTNYCATKFGLLGFAGALFEDIRERGIKVCSILPSVVNTDMHRHDPTFVSEKMIQAEDVAKTIQFVLSMPNNVCPTEITLMPQKNPRIYPKR